MKFDAFISHAFEDKEEVARPLAEALRKDGLDVWYDEFTLYVGDSLSKSIAKGMSESRFGIVVLSSRFFQKQWTMKELGGFLAKEDLHGNKTILPVWHKLTHKEVTEINPILADRLALRTSDGIPQIAKELAQEIRRVKAMDGNLHQPDPEKVSQNKEVVSSEQVSPSSPTPPPTPTPAPPPTPTPTPPPPPPAPPTPTPTPPPTPTPTPPPPPTPTPPPPLPPPPSPDATAKNSALAVIVRFVLMAAFVTFECLLVQLLFVSPASNLSNQLPAVIGTVVIPLVILVLAFPALLLPIVDVIRKVRPSPILGVDLNRVHDLLSVELTTKSVSAKPKVSLASFLLVLGALLIGLVGFAIYLLIDRPEVVFENYGSVDAATLIANRAKRYLESEDPQNAEREYRIAIRMLERLSVGPAMPLFVYFRAELAQALACQTRYESAAKEVLHAIENSQDLPLVAGGMNGSLWGQADLRGFLAEIRCNQGSFVEAAELYKQAKEMCSEANGSSYIKASIYAGVSDLLLSVEALGETKSLLEKAEPLIYKATGPQSRYMADFWRQRAKFARLTKEYSTADRDSLRASNMLNYHDYTFLVRALQERLILLLTQGETDKAKIVFDDLNKFATTCFSEPNTTMPFLAVCKAKQLDIAGKPEEAKIALEKALPLLRNQLEKCHPFIKVALKWHLRTCEEIGRDSEVQTSRAKLDQFDADLLVLRQQVVALLPPAKFEEDPDPSKPKPEH